MDHDAEEKIKARAYQIWEEEGRPEGQHEDHWERARQHVGMMGDGTQEQNLGQPGDASAKVTEEDVKAAFSPDSKRPEQP